MWLLDGCGTYCHVNNRIVGWQVDEPFEHFPGSSHTEITRRQLLDKGFGAESGGGSSYEAVLAGLAIPGIQIRTRDTCMCYVYNGYMASKLLIYKASCINSTLTTQHHHHTHSVCSKVTSHWKMHHALKF